MTCSFLTLICLFDSRPSNLFVFAIHRKNIVFVFFSFWYDWFIKGQVILLFCIHKLILNFVTLIICCMYMLSSNTYPFIDPPLCLDGLVCIVVIWGRPVEFFWPCSLVWNLAETNIVPAELLWEKNTVPVEKISRTNQI